MSDVNLGCQLSGGIDSSLITFLQRNIQKKLRHFLYYLMRKILQKRPYKRSNK